MSTKKQDDLFPQTALVPTGHQFSTSLSPSARTRSLVKAERWIEGEADKHRLVTRERAHNAQEAQRVVAAMYESGYREFRASAERIWEERTPNGRDPQFQRELDHIAAQFIRSGGGSIYAVTVDSVERIREDINRPLYRETREPRWYDRILGDD